jgi:hypothetical protein
LSGIGGYFEVGEEFADRFTPMAKPIPGHEFKRSDPGGREHILAAVEMELSAGRAKRHSANGARMVLRVFGLLLLLGLLAAGLGAMWYLQTTALQQRPVRHGAAVTSPAP